MLQNQPYLALVPPFVEMVSASAVIVAKGEVK